MCCFDICVQRYIHLCLVLIDGLMAQGGKKQLINSMRCFILF